MTVLTAQKPTTTALKAAAPAKAGAKAVAGDDEEETEGRPRSTYFLVKNAKELGNKRDATNHLKEHPLKDGEQILKGRAAEYRPVQVFALD